MFTRSQATLAKDRANSKLSWSQKQLIQICKQGGVPHHVAFVMDGNRRYAKTRNLESVFLGHEKGFEALLEALEVCLELGVRIVTVYAFSEENFSRPSSEVEGLMKLATAKFKEFLNVEEIVMKQGVIVDMLGRVELLPSEVRTAAAHVVLATKHNEGRARLNICFAYSGTEEVASAMRAVAKGLVLGELTPNDVNFDLISRCTYLGDMSPPDLLIRTSGETRLSDFLLWHLRDTKLVFINVLWPELTLWDLFQCMLEWQLSDRRETSKSKFPTLNARVEHFLQRVNEEKLNAWKAFAAEQSDSVPSLTIADPLLRS